MIPILSYEAPLTVDDAYVNANGSIIKNRNFRATDGVAFALFIATSKPVTIDGCLMVSKGTDCLHMNGYTSVTVTNSSFYGEYSDDGNHIGRAINNFMPRKFLCEHNYFETCRGIGIDHRDDTPYADSINIGYNIGHNITGIKKDLSGFVDKSQFIQFNTVLHLAGSAIYWNQFTNDAGASSVEDCISIYNSGGTQASPLLIHDNYISGAYPMPATAGGYTGSGITVEGDPGSNTLATMSAFVNASNNQIVSTMNAAMNIAGGHDIVFTGNRMVSASLLPDGVTELPSAWAGCCIFDSCNLGPTLFINNKIAGNTIGYNHWNDAGNWYPLPGRQDEENVLFGGVRKDNLMPYLGNTYLPNPVNLATEANELLLWKQKLTANGVILGPAGTSATVIPVTPVVPVTPVPVVPAAISLTMKVGDVKTGHIQPIDGTGANATYTLNSVTYASQDATVCKATEATSNEFLFMLTATGAGSTVATITLKDTAGNLITKKINITVQAVQPVQPLAVDITVTFDN